MEKKTVHNNTRDNSKAVVGLGLAALAAAAAGAVFFYGTDAGKKQRKHINSWMLRMRADVIDRMEKMKDWSEGSYYDLIDNVSEKYKSLKDIDREEVAAIAADLKKHWRNLKRHVESSTKKSPAKKRSPRSKTKTSTKSSDTSQATS